MKKLSLQTIVLGLQHVFAMFGACVLVPMLTGLNPSVALLGAGVGTLIFHLVTKKKVPVFLGSSFAFIASIQFIGNKYGLPYALGGIVAAGFMYLVYAVIVKYIGSEKIKELFPPVVTGTMIIIIGLTLAPSVLDGNITSATVGTLGLRWLVALAVVATVVVVSIFAKGFFKLIPILFGIAVGYAASFVLGMVDVTPLATSAWLQIPHFTLPAFNLESILLIAPLSFVTFMEHIGDITTNGSVVGQDFFKSPGLHRTLMGDGLATMFAGFIGAPANTTYSENTGVLAITKVYDPFIIRVAAVIAIAFSFIGKLGAILQTIPSPVIGGVSIVLFGMITSVGIRTLVEAKVDFSDSKNSLICAIMLVLGVSGVVLPLGTISFSGLSLAALIGALLNKVLPQQ